MKIEDVLFGMFLIGAVAFIVFLISMGISHFINSPIAADKANDYCKSQGFDNYADYVLPLYSSEPHGIKCGYAQKYVPVQLET